MITALVALAILAAGFVLWGWAYLLDRWGDRPSTNRTNPLEPRE
jgi:hypothetical protein